MTRDRAGEALAWTATVLLCVAAVDRYRVRGGPYLQAPQTVLDHAAPERHELYDALRVVPLAEPLIPRGANVAVVRVEQRQPRDDGSYMAAVGLLPHHVVLPPFAAARDVAPGSLPDYVIALGEPYDHPHYAVLAGFPDGWLYQVKR